MSEKAPEILLDQLVDEYVETKAVMMKRCKVPWDRLTIESNGIVSSNATVDHLFDYHFASETEAQHVSRFVASPPYVTENKKDIKTDDLTVTVKVKDGYPDLILTHYSICTARDEVKAAPYTWFFTHGPR